MKKQADYMRQTMVETRKSADAASRNASALMNAERAWLLLEKIEDKVFGSPSFFSFIVKNYGRTPAFVVKIVPHFGRYRNLDSLPDDPETISPNMILGIPEGGLAVGPGDALNEIAITLVEPSTLTDSERAEVLRGSLFLYACVFIRYRDIYDREFVSCFGSVYTPPGSPGAFEGFVRRGPTRYNKHT